MPAQRQQRGGQATQEQRGASQRTGGVSKHPETALVESKPIQQRIWRFSAPYPPSTNALYATVNGRRVKTAAARGFAAWVENAMVWLRTAYGVPVPPYRLTIELWAPDNRRRDADNGVKCLQDALLRATEHDDAEVVVLLVVKRGVDRVYPRADVTLEHAGGVSGRGAEEVAG